MENVWLQSALWLGLALAAAVISIWVAVSVALVEIMVGAVAGIGLCKRLRVPLHMISVEELPLFPTTVDEVVEEKQDEGRRFDRVIAEARARAKAARVRLERRVLAGHTVPTIVELIEREGCDLLVIGYMGRSALYNRLIGSTTDRLVELAPCHVLVVK